MVKNEWIKYVAYVIPHSNRTVELRLEGTPPMTMINVYAPQALRGEEEKDKFYNDLNKAIQQIPPKTDRL